MSRALEITYFHNLFQQNVLGNIKLFNEYKPRVFNWGRWFPALFPRDQTIKMQPTALATSTSPYLPSFTNFGEEKGRAGKQDRNKGRWLLLLQHFLWGDLSQADTQMGVLAEKEGKQQNTRKEIYKRFPLTWYCTGLSHLPEDPWSPLPLAHSSPRSRPVTPIFSQGKCKD